jgi:YHS domain-containing protein/thiol-disulfide isomerase/thioredoxin
MRFTLAPFCAGFATTVAFGFGLHDTAPAQVLEDRIIPWRAGFESAWSEAKQHDRPLWLQFTGPWCIHCRRMDLDTLINPAVVSTASTEVVPVKIRSDLREDLLNHYHVTSLPTTIVISPGGQVLARHVGYASPEGLLALLQESQARYQSSQRGLGGRCPVSLVRDGKLKSGRDDVIAKYDRTIYRFVDEASRKAFLATPERFVPASAGRCVVADVDHHKALAGRPELGVYHKERLYLFSTEEARTAFVADPSKYRDIDLGHSGLCPICQHRLPIPVPGSSRYVSIHNGRRYLFHAEEHREAFRQAPDRYLR